MVKHLKTCQQHQILETGTRESATEAKIVYKGKINSLSEATRFDRLRQKNLETEADQRLDSHSMQSSIGEKREKAKTSFCRAPLGVTVAL